MPSAASPLNPLDTDHESTRAPERQTPAANTRAPPPPEAIEMDTLPQGSGHGRSLSRGRRSMSVLRDDDKMPEASGAQGPLNKKDYAVGILLLLSVVVLWTASNFITQDLFEEGYDKPFFVTYMNTSAFSLYLIPFIIKRAWVRYRGDTNISTRRLSEEYQPLATSDEADELETIVKPSPESDLAPLTTNETAQLAIIFCFFWFIANWSVNASLNFTSVASATVLSSMSGFFTLGIGRIFRVEKLTLLKIAAVITSFIGVVLVSWSDSASPQKQPAGPASRPNAIAITNHAPRPALGDALALISALFYALYVILLKVRIKNESRVDMQLFFGFVGLFNVLTCWPIGLLLHYTGGEVFELPSSRSAVTAVLINMGITLSSDYLYVLAMLKTTPLVVTVGLSLTIPFAVAGDFIRGRPSAGKIIFGAILVLISFIAIGVDNGDSEQEGVQENAVRLQEEDDITTRHPRTHSR